MKGENPTASSTSTQSATASAWNQDTHGLPSEVNEREPPDMPEAPEVVHGAVVNVVLSTQPIQSNTIASEVKQRALSLENQVQADMIISIWTLHKQRYFTLSFASVPSGDSPSTATQSQTVSTTPKRLALSPMSSASAPSSNGSGTYSNSGVRSSATVTSPSSIPLSLAPFPLAGPESRSNVASTPSLLQKVTRLKDGMLDAMEIPIFAMWKDMSLAFPNKAGARLGRKHADAHSGNISGPFPAFTVYTEDFERELEPEEYPLVVLCKTQKPFRNWKIGLKSPETERHLRFVNLEHSSTSKLTVC